MKRSTVLRIAAFTLLMIFAAILLVGSVMFNGKTPSDEYMVLWNILPLLLMAMPAIIVIGTVTFIIIDRKKRKAGCPTLSDLEDPLEYRGMTNSQQLDILRDYAPDDMHPTVMDLPYLKSISHRTIKVVLYSKVGLTYEFRAEGECIGMISGNYTVIEITKAVHKITITSAYGRLIFDEFVNFDKVLLFTVKRSRNGETVRVEEIH